MTDASSLLHPVRLRIAQVLLSDGELSTTQLHERLSDIPIATLYRHINALHQAEMIEIAAEHAIRGTKERVYRLSASFSSPSQDDLTSLSQEELRGVFTVFASGLIGDFDDYLTDTSYDLAKDRVSFAQADFWATAEEVDEFTQTMTNAIEKLMRQPQTTNRRRRKLTTVILPRPETTGQSSEDTQ